MKPVLHGRLLAALSTVAVVASVICGLFLIGSPEQQREKKFDEKRISDLQGIAGSIDLYYTRHNSLPDNLEDLEKEPGISIKKSDPETGAAYTYTATSSSSYKLYADFSTESDAESPGAWAHGTGKYCFNLTAKVIDNR